MNFIDNKNLSFVSKLGPGYEKCIYFLINLVAKPQFGNAKDNILNEGIGNELNYLDII